MVSGGVAVLLLVLCVGLIIFLTARYKMNAFVVLLLVTFVFGFLVQMPNLIVIFK